MPINNIFWTSAKEVDFHIIVGHSSVDLTAAHLAFPKVNPEGATNSQFAKTYLKDASNVNDVTCTSAYSTAGKEGYWSQRQPTHHFTTRINTAA